MENVNIIGDLKLIKRRGIGSIMIGIICLLTVTIPVIYLFTPWSWFKIAVEAGSDTGFSSGSYLMNTMDIMKFLFTRNDEGILFILENAKTAANIRESSMSYYLVLENVYALAGWFLLASLFSVILVILGLVVILRGRLNNNKAFPVLSFLFALCCGMFLLDSWRLGYYGAYSMKKALDIIGASTETNSFAYKFWQNYVFAGCALLAFIVIWFIYMITLRKKFYEEDVQFVEDVEYAQRTERNGGNVLRNIVNVGGHKYSQNVYIESVSIADGVTTIGVGAFSNCLNLKEVKLPATIKRIGSNAFFNCPKLRKVQFMGNKSQWLKISRGTNWLAQAGTQTVLCKDGSFKVNQYK